LSVLELVGDTIEFSHFFVKSVSKLSFGTLLTLTAYLNCKQETRNLKFSTAGNLIELVTHLHLVRHD
jgi:hypothetical protein